MITYKLDEKFPAPLGGKTLTGGIPVLIKDERVVKFVEKLDGKNIYVRFTDKPDLAALVAEYDQAIIDRKNKAQAELEAAVPGLSELRNAKIAAEYDEDRYHQQFERMMDDEQNDGVRPPNPIDKSLKEKFVDLAEKYPRAALYLKAENQHDSAHWADNTGKGAAGKKAMDLLAANGSIEDALLALAERRDFFD